MNCVVEAHSLRQTVHAWCKGCLQATSFADRHPSEPTAARFLPLKSTFLKRAATFMRKLSQPWGVASPPVVVLSTELQERTNFSGGVSVQHVTIHWCVCVTMALCAKGSSDRK